METIHTQRLALVPITLDMIEAVMSGDLTRAEELAQARLPRAWPPRTLVEHAFPADLAAIRCEPERRLWGDRLMILPDSEPRIVGSVIFHGMPGDDGLAEVGYAVERASQGRGFATEATLASVEWALRQPECVAVAATTYPWHKASLRVLHKVGMVLIATREHETLGGLFIFERRRQPAKEPRRPAIYGDLA
jgi:RimJ/RimL family protein N-acetyltransferase